MATFPAYYDAAQRKYGRCAHTLADRDEHPSCGKRARFIVRSDIEGVEWIALCGLHARVWRRALPYVLMAQIVWGKAKPAR